MPSGLFILSTVCLILLVVGCWILSHPHDGPLDD